MEATVENRAALKGAEFLVRESAPEEVFTPEDFSEEQLMIRQAARDFALGLQSFALGLQGVEPELHVLALEIQSLEPELHGLALEVQRLALKLEGLAPELQRPRNNISPARLLADRRLVSRTSKRGTPPLRMPGRPALARSPLTPHPGSDIVS